MQLMGNKVEGAAASCMMSCLGWEEDQGLRSGRKAKVIWGAWEGKSIPWAGVELGRKVYPKGLQSFGSAWRPRWTRTLPSPNPKCVFLRILSAWSRRRKRGPSRQCRENNWTLCCLITTEPSPALRNPLNFRPLFVQIFLYVSRSPRQLLQG